jgi:hypothetical protein
MFVAASEKAKPMFRGQGQTAITRTVAESVASRLAAQGPIFFVDRDLKAAFDQLMSSGQACNTTAQNRHMDVLLRHASIRSRR